jgi:uncharacterized protein (DUF2252 family)
VLHLSPAERAERGKAARAEVPRPSHADWAPAAGRPDPIELIEQQNTTRVPELVPIRHGRMLVSPFAFFRGGALIMASDLATTPRSGLQVQLCGDAHLANFGMFGTAERNLVFDINDFDETHPGPWEWDLKRLAASLAVAARDRDFSAARSREIVLAAAEEYRTAMRGFAGKSNLDLWYSRMDIEAKIVEIRGQLKARQIARSEAAIAKARTKDRLRSFSKLTEVVDGKSRIISDPPLIVPIDELMGSNWQDVEDQLRVMFRDYRRTLTSDRRRLLERYELAHVARKVVGVGSVGTRAWIALLIGRDESDPLFMQIKEAQASVLEPFLGRSEYDNCGHRVVAGQRLMQSAGDLFLGWFRPARGALDEQRRDFYLRQLSDWKGGADIAVMRHRGMLAYGRLCAWTLARAHARSGDSIAIASYLGGGDRFDQAIAAFSEAYADQNERDYSLLVEAVKSGRLEAATGL